MSQLKFFRDEDGAPRAIGEDTTTLAQFLESDIQDDTETARTLLKQIKAARQGAAQEFCGNGFHLTMDAKQATLQCHATDDAEPTMLRLKTVKKALKAWLKFIA